ncbi:HEPN domain-containing protein [Methanospirillum purgamenti]|uniref:HEPN domain-containing protein n=1 Tax=Methanospirillum hungatei TaxID=2203 RepID=A0A8F5VNH6_METHU|nr:HEPN domain-containing protein [Methanospirillum hungatei]
MKAFLVFSDTEIPKTHSLIRLIRDCILIDTSFSELIDKNIDELTDFAVEIRYADEFYFPSIEEARDAIEKAEFVRSFVLSRITLIKQ